MSKINWVFQDEQGTNLNRYVATNVSTGEKITFDLLRGGSISVVGTPLNADNLNSLIKAINDNYDNFNNYVPTSRTINGYDLSEDLELDAEDVFARPNNWLPNKEDVGLGNVDNTADKDKSVKYAVSAGSVNLANITGVSTIYHHFVSIQVYNGYNQHAGTININLLYDRNKIDTLGHLINAINYCIDYNLDSQELSCTGCVYLNDSQYDGFMYVPYGMYTTSQDDIYVRAYRVGLTLVTEEFELKGSIVQDYVKPLLTLN